MIMVPLTSTQEDMSAIPSAHHGECEFVLQRPHCLPNLVTYKRVELA